MTNINAEQLATLARDIATFNPIDFGLVEKSENDAFLKMAEHVLSMDGSDVELMATVTYLLVENFVLHVQLMEKYKE